MFGLITFLSCALSALASPAAPYVLSVTASGDFSMQNRMYQFDPTDATNIYTDISYPYYESTLWGCHDKARGVYMLLVESGPEINFYDVATRNQTRPSLLLTDLSIQFPVAMHYAADTDTIWLLYVLQPTNQWCSIPGNASDVSQHKCTTFAAEAYQQPDASAYDPVTGMMWANMPSQSSGGAYLFGFDTASRTATQAIKMQQLCQHMQVVKIKGESTLVCVDFAANNLVSVDTSTGKTHVVYKFPPIHDPVMHSSMAQDDASMSTSSYFVQLQGPVEYVWMEIDTSTGTMLHNSSTLINAHLPLAMPIFVGELSNN